MRISSKPKVTVVTAVYNGERYVAETIQSVLDQSMGDFEYILIDDASTDRSVEVIREFNDPRIRLIRNEINSRLVVTRNKGLKEAAGEYIALIDHDDVALADRLKRQLEVLETSPELVLVGARARNIDSEGNFLKERPKYNLPTPEHSRVQLIFRNHFVNSTIFYRRPAQGFFYSPEFPLAEDYDFIERMASNGGVHVVDEVLVNYRIHANNYSSKTQDITREGCRKIKARQLARIGVEQDERSRRIFETLEYPAKNYDSSLMQNLQELMEMIRRGNEEHRAYDQGVLDEIISREIYMVAQTAAKQGGVGWNEIFSGEYLQAMRSKPLGVARANIRYLCRILGRRKRC